MEHDALELPYTPEFLQKHDGLVMSIGQFNQWVGGQLMATGLVQIWPGTPVSAASVRWQGRDRRAAGRQGVDRAGARMLVSWPGMDVRAALTVVGEGRWERWAEHRREAGHAARATHGTNGPWA